MSVFHRHANNSLYVFKHCLLMGTFLAYAMKSQVITLLLLVDLKNFEICFDTIVFRSVVHLHSD